TINYERIPPERSDSRIPPLIAWSVILLCVCTVMIRVQHAYKRAADLGVTNPSSELQVQFLGKTAVGMKGLLGVAPSAQQNQDQMIQSLDKYASSSAEKLRVATVVGELKGSDDALKRI